MWSFQPNLTLKLGNLTKNSRNNIQQLDYKYIKYLIKYSHFYLISLTVHVRIMTKFFCVI